MNSRLLFGVKSLFIPFLGYLVALLFVQIGLGILGEWRNESVIYLLVYSLNSGLLIVGIGLLIFLLSQKASLVIVKAFFTILLIIQLALISYF